MKKKSLITYRHFQIIAMIALSVFLVIEAFRQGDFNIFFEAGKDILVGENLYTKIYQGWLHYYYSPYSKDSKSMYLFVLVAMVAIQGL